MDREFSFSINLKRIGCCLTSASVGNESMRLCRSQGRGLVAGGGQWPYMASTPSVVMDLVGT